MYSKLLSLAALASVACAQKMNLTAALESNPNLVNLTQYLGFYPNIVKELSGATNVTLLAPSNEAFTKLLSGPAAGSVKANDTSLITALFTYHVLDGVYYASNITSNASFVPSLLTDMTYTGLPGGQVVEAMTMGKNVTFISGLLSESTVTQANINFTGGVIHVIDTFLTIPQNLSVTLDTLNLTSALGAIETISKAPGAAALPTNLTAFVPNNDAFQAIGSMLGNISITTLQEVIGYHIVPFVVDYSTLLKNASKLTTSINETLTVYIEDGSVFVNSAKVVLPNVLVSDGVVHVIDQVLNPAATAATPNATASTATAAFSGAHSASNVPFTSGIPAPSSAIMTPSAGTASGTGVASSAASAGASSSAAAAPMKTGAVGAAALFGAGALVMNY